MVIWNILGCSQVCDVLFGVGWDVLRVSRMVLCARVVESVKTDWKIYDFRQDV